MPNRLAELLHYLIWRCDPSKLGATKLNKILFFADFGANGLGASEAELFPDYLICLRTADMQAGEAALALSAMSSGMPPKPARSSRCRARA